MSIFGNIASAIFGSGKTPDAARASTTSGKTPDAVRASTTSAAPPLAPSAAPPRSSPKSDSGPPGQPMTQADVKAMIAKLADEQDEDLNWDKSIVDLMKLLKLDSSLGARKQLAQELGYTGALDGSAAMNIWLHKQVMIKLAETGGKVPESLKHA